MVLSMVVKTVSINFSRTNIRNFQKPNRSCVVNNVAARLNRTFLFPDTPSVCSDTTNEHLIPPRRAIRLPQWKLKPPFGARGKEQWAALRRIRSAKSAGLKRF
jgi:hypothetical protein